MNRELPLRRFALREVVQVPHLGPACLGRIESHEDGRHLKEPLPEWAYRVRPFGVEGQRTEVVVVGEESLRKLTEES